MEEITEELFDHKSKKRLNCLPANPEIDDGVIVPLGRFPSWLHRKLPEGGSCFKTSQIIEEFGLNTVCEEAKCPNRFECYSRGTATFLALGKACTRACGFCDIDFTKTPKEPEADEPLRIAGSVKKLGLKHVVITMVARDDLPDGGAFQIALIIQEIKKSCPEVTIEVLTSDFEGSESSLDKVLQASPEIFNHNIETVRRLSPRVRHKASYDRTLSVLEYVKKAQVAHVKSGIMVGLGETEEEVLATIDDLYRVGCSIITIGQYLQASRLKLPVREFVTPALFKRYEEYGKSIGVKEMYCGPFVRSSYNAHEIQEKMGVL